MKAADLSDTIPDIHTLLRSQASSSLIQPKYLAKTGFQSTSPTPFHQDEGQLKDSYSAYLKNGSGIFIQDSSQVLRSSNANHLRVSDGARRGPSTYNTPELPDELEY